MKKNVRGLDSNTLLSHKVQNPIIPVTVQDQIRLWELERHRVKGQDGKLPEKAKYAKPAECINTGYLYKDFGSMNDYEVVVKYARELGVVLWENGAKRMFFADAAGRVLIRNYIERRTAI
jgi:transcription initiation factor TFIIH subunit 4